MSAFTDCVSRRYGPQLAKRVDRDGCRLAVDGRNDLTILDCDRFEGSTGKKSADFLVLASSNALVVELKSGRVRAPLDILEQLQAGADQLADVFKACPTRVSRFIPVVLHGRKMHTVDLRVLTSRKIKLGSHSSPPIVKRCGSHIDDVIDD